MSCTGCAGSFGVFRKEHGCSNCGFAFCSKCLGQKAVVARVHATKLQTVCRKCHHVLSNPAPALPTPPNPGPPLPKPAITVKLPETLHYSQQSKDKDIRDRLDRLKRERTAVVEHVTQEELEQRLAKLKDEPGPAARHPMYIPPETRTESEQSRDLLKQMGEEVELDHGRDPVAEISARLARLKEGRQETGPKSPAAEPPRERKAASVDAGDSDLDSEEEARRLVERLAVEAEMERRLGEPEGLSDDSAQGHEDELPWCCICNEDAALRCLGCDGDLYCRRCYREGHDSFDLRDHGTVPFAGTSPRKGTSAAKKK